MSLSSSIGGQRPEKGDRKDTPPKFLLTFLQRWSTIEAHGNSCYEVICTCQRG
jgi:hypothetical protein